MNRRRRDDNPSYAVKIRELREALDMTQPTIAGKIGVTRGTIAKWEEGSRQPRVDNCRALADLAADAFLNLQAQRGQSGERLPRTERAESLHQLAVFFRKKAVNRKDMQREEDYAISQLIGVLREAREGDATAKEFLEVSSLEEDQFWLYRRRWMDEQEQKIKDHRTPEHSEMIRAAVTKFYKAETIWRGRRFLVARGLAAVRRELERLGANPDDFLELERLIGIQASLGSGAD